MQHFSSVSLPSPHLCFEGMRCSFLHLPRHLSPLCTLYTCALHLLSSGSHATEPISRNGAVAVDLFWASYSFFDFRDLSRNNISGTIPPSLFNWNLKFLYVQLDTRLWSLRYVSGISLRLPLLLSSRALISIDMDFLDIWIITEFLEKSHQPFQHVILIKPENQLMCFKN